MSRRSLRELVADAERLPPGDVSRRRLHGNQLTPGRLLAGQPRAVADGNVETGRARRGFLVRQRRVVAGLHHPAERAHVLRDDQQVVGSGIERDPAPVRPADAARKVQGGPRRCAFRAVDPGGERAGAVDLAERLDELGAGRGVRRGRVGRRHEIGRLIGDASHRGRLDRERLARIGRLPGDVAVRHRAFLDAEDRLAALAVQDVQIARLGGHAEGRDGAPVLLDVEQHGRRGRVGIPQIMADRLEVPAVLAGLRVDRHHGVAVQVGALAVAAIGAGDGRGKREVHEAARLVHGEVERPGVGAQPITPAVALPGVVSHVARLRHGVELPQRVAAARVERTGVADAADSPARRVRADHDDVSEDERHGVVRHAQVDGAAVAEPVHGRAGRRVEGVQAEAAGEEDARRQAVSARPPGDPAPGRRAVRQHVPPVLPAADRVERGDAIGPRQVHHAVDDDGGGLRPRARRVSRVLVLRGAQRIGPGLREAGHVAGVHLRERGVAGARGIAAVQRPAASDRGGFVRRRPAAAAGRACQQYGKCARA